MNAVSIAPEFLKLGTGGIRAEVEREFERALKGWESLEDTYNKGQG